MLTIGSQLVIFFSTFASQNIGKTRTMNRKMFILLVINVLFVSMRAQRIPMSIERLFELCDENSKELQLKELEIDRAEQALKVAKSNWSPSIDVSLSASYLGSGIVTDRNFSNLTNAGIPPFGNNLAIEAQQVLYSGGAFSSQIKIAELGVRIAELARNDNRQAQHFLMVSNYLELYKLRNQIRVYEKNIELTEQLLEDIKSKHGEGVALKNDITRYELQLQNIQLGLTVVQNAISIINHDMVVTLGLDEGTEIIPDTLLAVLPIVESEQKWQTDARQMNNAIRQAECSVNQGEAREKLVRSEMIPKIALFAANKLDGPILIEVPTLNKNIDYWYAGIGVTYSLSSLYKSNRKLRKAQYETECERERYGIICDQIEIAVNAAYTSYLESLSIYETRKTGVVLSNENYDVVSKRYLNDLALISDMLDATMEKLNSELLLENAKANIYYNYYKLKQLTNTL